MSGPHRDAAYWREVEEIFSAVIERPVAERDRLLAALVAAREDLRADVEALLNAHGQSGNFIRPITVAGASFAVPPAASAIGIQAGSFQLVEAIDEGGMGAVYRAERVEGDFTQQAAIKLIAARLQAPDTLRRFNIERQILASLQHPNIVALIDGGVAANGQPYIAMEYIAGVPITAYCASRAAPLRDRLKLFLQLCAAVRFAHRHLVIHRDLKPGNVLVTADGTVKVLDFGIAKLLQEDGVATDATIGAVGPLTADYASPEQLRGGVVTTASDVYSLGVLLFELLANERPYRTGGKTLDAILAIVLDDAPPRPSTVADASLPYSSSELRGDLDAIVLKAMAKEVERRYASVEELAADVQRWLDQRPVLARPDSPAYVMGKFARRHRVAVVTAAVAMVAVLGGLGSAIWQARVARAERDRATTQMRTAQLTTDFLSNIFEAANPVAARGATITAHDLLDAGAGRIAKDLAGEPDAQQRLLVLIGHAYDRLGAPKQALVVAERALTLARAGTDSDSATVADSLGLMGLLWRRYGRPAEAIPLLEEAIRRYELVYGPDDSRVAETLRDLALAKIAVGATADARSLLERAIRIQESRAPTSASLGRLLNNLGNMQERQGDTDGALAAFERSIAIYEQSNEPDSWGLALPLLSLGDARRAVDDFARARRLFERALKIDEDTFGYVSTSTAYTLARLGELATAEGRLADARQLLDESRRIYGLTEAMSTGARFAQAFDARLRIAEGRAAEARPMLQDVLARIEAAQGKEHVEAATALMDLAAADLALGKRRDAQSAMERALAIRRAALPAKHRDVVKTERALRALGAR